MRDKTGDNEPLDAMPFELQVQIGVSKATGTPMLLSYDVSRLWGKLGAELAAPSSIFKRLSRAGCLLTSDDSSYVNGIELFVDGGLAQI